MEKDTNTAASHPAPEQQKEPIFRYFPDAYAVLKVYRDVCDVCGQTGTCVPGVYYGQKDYSQICGGCIAGGRLKELGIHTNEADIPGLKEQLKGQGMPDDQIKRLARERTDELEYRTPGFATFQNIAWPACCGDYCSYLHEAGQADYRTMAGKGKDPEAFFKESLYDQEADIDRAADLWNSISPLSGLDPAYEVFATAAYLFRCGVCKRAVTLWDTE